MATIVILILSPLKEVGYCFGVFSLSVNICLNINPTISASPHLKILIRTCVWSPCYDD